MSTPTFPQIAVLTQGFVYVGFVSRAANGDITITQAQNIRRWGTTRGLGELAHSGPTGNTRLDPTGTVHAPAAALVHLIDCHPAAWPILTPAVAA